MTTATELCCGVSLESREPFARVQSNAEGWVQHERLPRTEARGRRNLASDLLSAGGIHHRHVPRAFYHRREALMATLRRRVGGGAGRVMLEGSSLFLNERRIDAIFIYDGSGGDPLPSDVVGAEQRSR